MAEVMELAGQIDAAFAAMEEKRKKFQVAETTKHQEWEARLEKLGKVFESMRGIWRPRLETLIKKFGDKVAFKPNLTPSARDVEMNFQSDVARIRLRFQATTDSDIRKVILNYDLEIIPVLMKFDSHAELEMPLDNVDQAAVSRWIDERILSFVKTYIALHENQYYQRDQMVIDPVTGTQFPKMAAGAKIEQGGKTVFFVSEETRREYEKKNVAATK